MTQVVESPVIDQDLDTDSPQVAHIVSKESHMRGYVLGETIQALCGEWFIPTRDPNKFPLCESCKEMFNRLLG